MMTSFSAALKQQAIPKKSLKKMKAVKAYNKRLPNIVLIGSERLRKSLIEIEKKFSIIIKCTSFDDIEEVVDHLTISILIDENSIDKSPQKIISDISLKYSHITTLYLVRSKQRDSFYDKLYSAGVNAIVKWPTEKKIIAELVLESLKPHPKATGQSKSDEKLSKMIKAHILLNNGPKNIKVFTVDGFVFLTGKVKNLWQAHELKLVIGSVLGVKKIIAKDLVVVKSKKVTTKEIERNIKVFISHLLGKQKRSIGVTIKSSTATIKGSIPSKVSLDIIKKYIMKQPNINFIIDKSKVDDETAIKRSNTVKKLEQKVTLLFDGVKKLSIRFLGNTLEISGTVNESATKNLIEEYLIQKLPVNRTINKIVTVSHD